MVDARIHFDLNRTLRRLETEGALALWLGLSRRRHQNMQAQREAGLRVLGSTDAAGTADAHVRAMLRGTDPVGHAVQARELIALCDARVLMCVDLPHDDPALQRNAAVLATAIGLLLAIATGSQALDQRARHYLLHLARWLSQSPCPLADALLQEGLYFCHGAWRGLQRDDAKTLRGKHEQAATTEALGWKQMARTHLTEMARYVQWREPVALTNAGFGATSGGPVPVLASLLMDLPTDLLDLNAPSDSYNAYLPEVDDWSGQLVKALTQWERDSAQPLNAAAVQGWASALADRSATCGLSDLSQLAGQIAQCAHALGVKRHAPALLAQAAATLSHAAQELRALLHQFAAGFLKTPSPATIKSLKALQDGLQPPSEQGPFAPRLESLLKPLEALAHVHSHMQSQAGDVQQRLDTLREQLLHLREQPSMVALDEPLAQLLALQRSLMRAVGGITADLALQQTQLERHAAQVHQALSRTGTMTLPVAMQVLAVRCEEHVYALPAHLLRRVIQAKCDAVKMALQDGRWTLQAARTTQTAGTTLEGAAAVEAPLFPIYRLGALLDAAAGVRRDHVRSRDQGHASGEGSTVLLFLQSATMPSAVVVQVDAVMGGVQEVLLHSEVTQPQTKSQVVNSPGPAGLLGYATLPVMEMYVTTNTTKAAQQRLSKSLWQRVQVYDPMVLAARLREGFAVGEQRP